MKRDVKIQKRQYDVVVVGGGLSGICAAIASARLGIKTALIHSRHVLCDKINIVMYNTNGYESASVFEVRIY